MLNPTQAQTELIEVYIQQKDVISLLKLKNDMVRWIPKELLNYENHLQYEMIENALNLLK